MKIGRLSGKEASKGSGKVTREQAQKNNLDLNKPESLRGAKPSEVKKLIPKNWIKKNFKKGKGCRYINPEKKGETIMIEKGWNNAQDSVHSGPYIRISKD